MTKTATASMRALRRTPCARIDTGAATQRTYTIGLFLETRSRVADDFFRGILSYLRERQLSWNFRLSMYGEVSRQELRNRTGLDGMIFDLAGRRVLEMDAERWAREINIPAVDIDPQSDEGEFPAAMLDDYAIGQTVATHFLQRGFAHFGFLGISEELYFCRTRRRGFQDAIEAAGGKVIAYVHCIQVQPDQPWPPLNGREQRQQLDAWLAALPKPVAIMTAVDDRSRHLLESCRRLELRVPQDVAICGVDGKAICEIETPPLSSVPPNLPRIGYAAAELLDRLMRGEPSPIKPVMVQPAPLIVRQSSDVFASADSDVQTALQFIRSHAGRPLRIEPVVDAVLVSRRSLEQKFRAQLGQGIQEEIWRAHLDRAKQLLADTHDDLRAVAHASGFRTPLRLGQVFRKYAGMCPREYRRLHGH